jgi:hypothetical protein
MAKLMINFFVFALAAQIVCYLLFLFDVFGGMIDYPLGDVTTMQSVFAIDTYSVIIGAGGAVGIGLAALLLKQGVYAVYAMLLWGIGTLFSVVRTFITVIPNTLAALIPKETNPLAYTNGVFDPSSTAIHPFIVVIMLMFAFGAWMYFFGLVIQREPT